MRFLPKRFSRILTYVLICACILVVYNRLHSRSTARDCQSKNAIEKTQTTTPSEPGMEIPVCQSSTSCKSKSTSQIIEHVGYTVSYNPQWRIPNWVAYELTRQETTGTEERSNHFNPDPAVKGVCPETRDYANSGYDRGHMAPAADMKWSEQAMDESFYMTNICPQNHNLNAGDWRILEEQVRDWAEQYGAVYVACGPLVGNHPQTIGQAGVSVPDAFYKVLLCKIGGQWQAIGFHFLNQPGHKPLSTYCKSVDEIEKLTGFDFFSKLEDKIENDIEANYDINTWNIK